MASFSFFLFAVSIAWRAGHLGIDGDGAPVPVLFDLPLFDGFCRNSCGKVFRPVPLFFNLGPLGREDHAGLRLNNPLDHAVGESCQGGEIVGEGVEPIHGQASHCLLLLPYSLVGLTLKNMVLSVLVRGVGIGRIDKAHRGEGFLDCPPLCGNVIAEWAYKWTWSETRSRSGSSP